MAVMDALEDLLDTVRGVGLAVEFPRDNVLEELAAGDSESCRASKAVLQSGWIKWSLSMCNVGRYLQVEYEVVVVLLLYTVV